ncbi:hypothetical protein AB0F36_07895 [Streptomyces sp. NPDC029080]|uniref:hypothetical protein n=1 Tax=Streptomyces sp. NPDC029080 TaxID=3155017 RepID=UPI0033F58F04
MAELSYPFSAANGSGGSNTVSQAQWQKMARMWGGDRVDRRLTASSYESTDLPFYTSTTGRTVVVNAGRAWVGGFYYELTGTQSLTIADNTSKYPRIDIIVLRADLTAGSVNLAVVAGQPAATPVAPQPTRATSGNWEMVLHEVAVPANNAAISVSSRLQFDMPPVLESPWNTDLTASYVQSGTFLYDMDVNRNTSQTEGFKGRDGFMWTRTLGKSYSYTPSMFNGKSSPGVRKGRYRWIAPNTVYFEAEFDAYEDVGVAVSGSNTYLGITLPTPASGAMRQVLTGLIANPAEQGNMPNLMQITALTGSGTSNVALYTQNWTNLAQGLDGLRLLPPQSKLYISGTYEANVFNE